MPDEPTSSFIPIDEEMLVNDVGSEQLLLTLGRSSGPDVTPAKGNENIDIWPPRRKDAPVQSRSSRRVASWRV